MKKYILAIAVAMASLFASCSSDSVINEPITNEDTLHEAVFTINSVAPQMGTVETRSTSLTDAGIKYLEYWVFKTEEISWTMNFQPVLRASVTDYNTPIALQLPKGDYTIIFFASDSDEEIKSTPQATVKVVDGKYQMYSAKNQFVISDENTVIKEYISLDRINGKLEFVIEDLNTLPEEVQSISILGTSYSSIMSSPKLLAKMGSINLATGDAIADIGAPLLPTIPRSDFDKYNKENPISTYVIPSGTNKYASTYTFISHIYIQGSKDDKFYDLNMAGSLADQNSKVAFMRKVGYYKVEANRVTRYTGKIDNLNQANHNVSFEDEWTTSETDAD